MKRSQLPLTKVDGLSLKIACQNGRRLRDVWRIDSRPTDIHGRVEVCVGSVPAGPTEERRLRHPIALLAMPANRAGLRGVTRIDSDQRNACELGLVRQERAQLMECPGMQIIALRATEPNTTTDAREVFNGNPAAGAFRLFDDLLTDPVVLIGCEAGFPAGDRRQSATGATGPIRLETPTLATTALADAQHHVTRKDHAVRVAGDVLDAHVNAQPAVRVEGVVLDNVADLVQVELAVAKDEIAFALEAVQQFALAIPANERDSLAPAHRPDRDRGLLQLPGQNAVVVGGRPHLAERAFGALVELVAVGDDSNHPDGRLSGQAKPLPDGVVGGVVQVVGPEGLAHPSMAADVVGGLVPRQKRAAQRIRLFFGRLELDLRYQFHGRIVPYLISDHKYQKGGCAIPPPAQAGGFLARSL
jgi:hypothetical protein